MQALRMAWATCFSTVKVLRRTMPRLCDSTALQLRRGMQTLRTTWATCLSLAKVLRRTEQRPSDCTASPPRRGMLELKPTWSDWARDAREARCPFHAARLTIPRVRTRFCFAFRPFPVIKSSPRRFCGMRSAARGCRVLPRRLSRVELL